MNAANKAGQADLSTGYSNINTGLAAGLAPLLQNYSGNSAGTTQLAKLLGIGPGGPGDIQTTLENLPGYQFTRDQGTQNVERQNAAQGFGTGPGGPSGNTQKAVADYTTGLANTNYNNYATQLLPYLGAQTTTGGQIANTDLAGAALQNTNRTSAASMDYGTNANIGNANANADLAGLTASGNLFNILQNVFKTGVGGSPSIAGNVGSMAKSLYGMLPQSGGGE